MRICVSARINKTGTRVALAKLRSVEPEDIQYSIIYKYAGYWYTSIQRKHLLSSHFGQIRGRHAIEDTTEYQPVSKHSAYVDARRMKYAAFDTPRRAGRASYRSVVQPLRCTLWTFAIGKVAS